MRNGSGFTTMFGPRQRLTGCFSETFSFLKTTCGSLDSLAKVVTKLRLHICRLAHGMTLDELLRLTEGRVSSDDIFSMIAANIIPVDLHAAPLAEP